MVAVDGPHVDPSPIEPAEVVGELVGPDLREPHLVVTLALAAMGVDVARHRNCPLGVHGWRREVERAHVIVGCQLVGLDVATIGREDAVTGVQRSSMPLSNRSRTIGLRPVIMNASGDVSTISDVGASGFVMSCVQTANSSPVFARAKSSANRIRPLSVCTNVSAVKHGLLPLIRPVVCAVCHLLIVVSNWSPGSAHSHAACGDLAPQVAGADGLHDLAGGDGLQCPVGVLDDGLHELVGDAHRVVGVLVLDRERVGAVEVHVEPGVTQRPSLALLLDLAPDELLDVGMIGVEDDHLRRPSGLAARLDRARRRVGTAHEAHRTRRRAAALEQLLRSSGSSTG